MKYGCIYKEINKNIKYKISLTHICIVHLYVRGVSQNIVTSK